MDREHIAYVLNRGRNKSQVSEHLQLIRKKLIESNGKKCSKCLKEFNTSYLELDHIIPISIGGAIFDNDNFQILCNYCHKKKTYVDNSTVACLKRFGFVRNEGFRFLSFVEPKRLIELFKQVRELTIEGKIYDEAYKSFDYTTFIYEGNRELGDKHDRN
jgi:hypothetical protein